MKERITLFKPAYDGTIEEPEKDYGIGSVRCLMLLKGDKGAVHFSFGTGMFLPETLERLAGEDKLVHKMPHRNMVMNEPMGYDVGYHSLEPQFEGQEINWPKKMRKTGPGPLDVVFDKIGDTPPNCDWLGVPCYCDGSALQAEEYMKVLLTKGSDAIWELLENDYKELFEKNDTE